MIIYVTDNENWWLVWQYSTLKCTTHPDIIKVNHASPRGSQSKLVFFLAYAQSRTISFNNETSDSFVTLEILKKSGNQCLNIF
jgi:hypothetical protein